MGKKSTFTIIDKNSIEKLYEVLRNVCLMLTARGVSKDYFENYFNMTYSDFKNYIAESEDSIPHIIAPNKVRKTLSAVIFYPIDNVNRKNTLSAIEDILNTDFPEFLDNNDDGINYKKNIIFVTTPKSYKKIKTHLVERPFSKTYGAIDYETFDEIFFYEDKVSNKMVPKHELLTDTMLAEIIKTDPGFKKEDLPILPKNDPICLYYAFPENSVIKITRYDEVSLIETSYRIVYSNRTIIMRNL